MKFPTMTKQKTKYYIYFCKYCRRKAKSRRPDAKVCTKKSCRAKYQVEYKKNKNNTSKERSGGRQKNNTIDSTCPYCREIHQGQSKWEYCQKHLHFRYQ